jgi:hypothetical protein
LAVHCVLAGYLCLRDLLLFNLSIVVLETLLDVVNAG